LGSPGKKPPELEIIAANNVNWSDEKRTLN
jgi:hypothetical protein